MKKYRQTSCKQAQGSCSDASPWHRTVRELRFAHWEALEALPRMEPDLDSVQAGRHNGHWEALQPPEGGRLRRPAAPDLAACLLHQKLQLLDCCAFLRRHPEAGFVASQPVPLPGCGGAEAAASTPAADTPEGGQCKRTLSAALLEEAGLSAAPQPAIGLGGGPVPAWASAAAAAAGGPDQDSDTRVEDPSESEAVTPPSALEASAESEEFASCVEEDEEEEGPGVEGLAELQRPAGRAAGNRGVQFPSLVLRVPPLVTSDMLAEREAALSAMGKATAVSPQKTLVQ